MAEKFEQSSQVNAGPNEAGAELVPSVVQRHVVRDDAGFNDCLDRAREPIRAWP